MGLKSNNAKSIMRSILGFSLPSWINAAASFLIIPVFTRLMLPEETGIFSMFTTYSSMLFSISLLGLNQGFMRFYAEIPGKNTKGSFFRLMLLLVSIPSILVCVLIVIFGRQLSFAVTGYVDKNIIICLCISIVSSMYSTMINAKYRMEQNISWYCAISILCNSCSTLAYVATILTTNSGTTAIFFLTALQLIVLVPFLCRELASSRGSKIFWKKTELSEVLKFSLPLVLVMAVAQINTSLPKLIMQKHMTYADIGIYSAVTSVVGIITILQAGVNVYWPPFVYANYKEHPELLSKAHELVLFICTLFGLVLLTFQDLIFFLLGVKYRTGQSIFPLLMLSPIFYLIAETTGAGINISKKSYLNIIPYTTGIVVNAVICSLSMKRFGLYGLASSVAISAITMFVIRTLAGERYYKVIRNPGKSFTGVVMLIFASILNTWFMNQPSLRIGITLVIILLLVGYYRSECTQILGFLKKAIHKKAR